MIDKLACTAVLLAALPLAAAADELDFFLKVDGIFGETRDAQHKDEIDVTSWSWGLSQAPGTQGGGGGAGKPTFQDFSWTQGIDRSVVPMFLDVATRKRITNVTLDVVRLDGVAATSFFTLSFSDVYLTTLQFVGSGTAQSAAASLYFGKVTMRYRAQRPDGTYDDWIEGGFDVADNTPLFTGNPQVLAGLTLAGGTMMPLAVPEPQTWVLMLGGLLGTGAWVRRRAAASQ